MTRLTALAAGLVALDLAQPPLVLAGAGSQKGGALLFCSFVFLVIIAAVLAHQLATRRPK